MKTLITYYSYSGITDKVVKMYADLLKKNGEVTLQRLTPKTEITTFLGQCKAAFSEKRAELEGDVKFDVKDYDLVIIGSPVWAFAPVPAVNTYLDKVSQVEGKRVIVLLTSGSGTGVGRCYEIIRKIFENKKAAQIEMINVSNRVMSNGELIISSFEKLLGGAR